MSRAAVVARPVDRRALRRVAAITLVVAFALLAIRVGRWLMLALWAVDYPFQLDYAEGIVWQQAEMMRRGVAYGDMSNAPFIVFHYPPIFHVASLLVSRLGGADLLLAGRAVSVAAAIGAAAVLARLVATATDYDRGVRWMCGLTAAMFALSFEPVGHWALTYRVDMLAVCLSVQGLYFGLRSLDRPRYGHLAAACFVAAVFTKPTTIAAPLAVTLFMLWRRPSLAWRGMAVGALLFVVAGGIAVAVFGRGVPVHILGYNINRIHLPNLGKVVLHVLIQAPCVALATLTAWRCLRDEWVGRHGAPGSRPHGELLLLASLYFCATSASTMSIIKSGADSNYLIEWMVAVALLAGAGLLEPVSRVFRSASLWTDTDDGSAKGASPQLRAAAVGYFLAMQFLLVRDLPLTAHFGDPQARARAQTVADVIGAANGPVASEDMVLLMRAGKQVIFEPMIINELVAMGIWDETPLVGMVRDETFAFFVTRGRDVHDRTFGWPYSDAMTRAIEEHYPHVSRLGDYWIHRPQPRS